MQSKRHFWREHCAVSGFGAKPDSAAMLVLLNQQQQHIGYRRTHTLLSILYLF
jgi:hypothetical protein